MAGWRVKIVTDEMSFLRDEIKLFMAYTDDNGVRMVAPLEFVLEAHTPKGVEVGTAAATMLPRELAEELFGALSYALTAVADPHHEIMRLKRELTETKKMLGDLISGIGRLGGQKET